MDVKPQLDQVNLVVRDLKKSLVFFRLLGLEFGEPTGLHDTFWGCRFAISSTMGPRMPT